MTDQHESFGSIVIGDAMVELGRHNTRLYTYLGSLAVYDHLFVDKTETTGAYLWRVADQDFYFRYASLASENKCMQFLNLQEVAELDRMAFDSGVLKNLSDVEHVPSDWLIE